MQNLRRRVTLHKKMRWLVFSRLTAAAICEAVRSACRQGGGAACSQSAGGLSLGQPDVQRRNSAGCRLQ